MFIRYLFQYLLIYSLLLVIGAEVTKLYVGITDTKSRNTKYDGSQENPYRSLNDAKDSIQNLLSQPLSKEILVEISPKTKLDLKNFILFDSMSDFSDKKLKFYSNAEISDYPIVDLSEMESIIKINLMKIDIVFERLNFIISQEKNTKIQILSAKSVQMNDILLKIDASDNEILGSSIYLHAEKVVLEKIVLKKSKIRQNLFNITSNGFIIKDSEILISEFHSGSFMTLLNNYSYFKHINFEKNSIDSKYFIIISSDRTQVIKFEEISFKSNTLTQTIFKTDSEKSSVEFSKLLLDSNSFNDAIFFQASKEMKFIVQQNIDIFANNISYSKLFITTTADRWNVEKLKLEDNHFTLSKFIEFDSGSLTIKSALIAQNSLSDTQKTNFISADSLILNDFNISGHHSKFSNFFKVSPLIFGQTEIKNIKISDSIFENSCFLYSAGIRDSIIFEVLIQDSTLQSSSAFCMNITDNFRVFNVHLNNVNLDKDSFFTNSSYTNRTRIEQIEYFENGVKEKEKTKNSIFFFNRFNICEVSQIKIKNQIFYHTFMNFHYGLNATLHQITLENNYGQKDFTDLIVFSNVAVQNLSKFTFIGLNKIRIFSSISDTKASFIFVNSSIKGKQEQADFEILKACNLEILFDNISVSNLNHNKGDLFSIKDSNFILANSTYDFITLSEPGTSIFKIESSNLVIFISQFQNLFTAKFAKFTILIESDITVLFSKFTNIIMDPAESLFILDSCNSLDMKESAIQNLSLQSICRVHGSQNFSLNILKSNFSQVESSTGFLFNIKDDIDLKTFITLDLTQINYFSSKVLQKVLHLETPFSDIKIWNFTCEKCIFPPRYYFDVIKRDQKNIINLLLEGENIKVPINETLMMHEEGYYASIYGLEKCPVPKYCHQNQYDSNCENKYNGVYCYICDEENYKLFDGNCGSCYDLFLGFANLIMLFIGSFPLVRIFYNYLKMENDLSSYQDTILEISISKIIIQYFQIFSLIFSLNFDIEFIQNLGRFLYEIFSKPSNLITEYLLCSYSESMYKDIYKIISWNLIPLLKIAFVVSTLTLNYKKIRTFNIAKVIIGTSIMNELYGIAITNINLTKCIESPIGSGMYHEIETYNINCKDESYSTIFSLVMSFFSIWVIILPYSIYHSVKFAKKSDKERIQNEYGPLLAGYNDGYEYLEFINILSTIFLAFSAAYLGDILEVLIMIFVLTGVLKTLIVLKLNPFKHEEVLYAYIFLQAIVIVSLYGLHVVHYKDPDNVFWNNAMLFVLIITHLSFITYIIYIFDSIKKRKFERNKNSLSMENLEMRNLRSDDDNGNDSD